MRKSSRSISLALIGSALMIGGCQPSVVEEPESEWGDSATTEGIATANDQYNNGTHHSSSGGRTASRIGGAIIGSQIGRSLGGGGGGGIAPGPSHNGGGFGGSAAPSARGGFGSSAGHSSAST